MSVALCKIKCRAAAYLSDRVAQLHYGIKACSPDYTDMELADDILQLEIAQSGIICTTIPLKPTPPLSNKYPFPAPSDPSNCSYFPGSVPQIGGCQGIIPCIPPYTP